MSTWSTDDLDRIGNAQELEVTPDRQDGTAGRATTIWVVRVAEDLYVRSYRGSGGLWYRHATASGHGRISADGIERQVSFQPDPDIDCLSNQVRPLPDLRRPHAQSRGPGDDLAPPTPLSTQINHMRDALASDRQRTRNMILQDTYALSNGVEIPKLGLGTWFIDNDRVAQAVRGAVGIGYRHIDTAQAYGNEQGVGQGIRSCGVARDEIFVTTKLAAEIKSYDQAAEAIDGSLGATGLDYLDMMIIHSPQPWQEFGGDDRYLEGNREAWRALEDAYQAGKLRAIGLSNFQAPDIDNILSSSNVDPMVNQILAHITNTPAELIRYSRSKGMVVEAYSPIAHGELVRNPQVTAMADKYGVSVPQLSIRYDLQLGLLPLPKTGNPERMRTNADVDFVISAEDMDYLADLERIKDYGSASVFPVYSGR